LFKSSHILIFKHWNQ